MGNFAFQISDEDIIAAGRKHFGQEWDYAKAGQFMDSLDLEMIEEAALNGGCEMDEQTEAAIGEIALQLLNSHHDLIPLSSSPLKRKSVGELFGHLRSL